jgi:hypothetical protein
VTWVHVYKTAHAAIVSNAGYSRGNELDAGQHRKVLDMRRWRLSARATALTAVLVSFMGCGTREVRLEQPGEAAEMYELTDAMRRFQAEPPADPESSQIPGVESGPFE